MSIPAQTGRVLYALAFIGLGFIGLGYGDFALVWQRIPIEHLPGRTALAYLCAALELALGLSLLLPRTAAAASRFLFVYVALWLLLLKLPAVVAVPSLEATWLGFGEISMIVAGAWVLYAGYHTGTGPSLLTGESGIAAARLLLALAIPMDSLSHFFYADATAYYVPDWMPWRHFWAYCTGSCGLAASAGMLLRVWPRVAATLEAAMQSLITLLVWAPPLLAAPEERLNQTGFLISSVIALGCWLVADSYRGEPWLSVGWRKQ